MDQNLKRIQQLQMEECKTHLLNHGFACDLLEKKEDVLTYLQEHIEKGSVISVGGSMSLFETGVIDWLTDNDEYNYLDRYHTDDRDKIFHETFNADVYLTSTNALTLDGMLYNVDGTGNRVAAMLYGPKKVYVIVGINKLVKNIDEAVVRNEMISAPANNVRLNKENICTKTGRCMHCDYDKTICNDFVVIRRCANKERIHVLLVEEELGY